MSVCMYVSIYVCEYVDASFGRLSAASWCLPAGQDSDAQEAELSVAKGGQSTAVEWEGDYGVYSW